MRRISFAEIGDDRVAVRFTATSGPLRGFELIQLGAHSGDVLVGMTVVGLPAADAEQATKDAVAKVEKRLGTGGTI